MSTSRLRAYLATFLTMDLEPYVYSPPGDGPAFPIHSNRMLLNEDAMAAGSAMHAAVALRWLETGV